MNFCVGFYVADAVMSFAINVEESGKIRRRHVLVHFGPRIASGTMTITETSMMTIYTLMKKRKSFMIQMMSTIIFDQKPSSML